MSSRITTESLRDASDYRRKGRGRTRSGCFPSVLIKYLLLVHAALNPSGAGCERSQCPLPPNRPSHSFFLGSAAGFLLSRSHL
jgi:hypothetical protein